MTHVYYPIYALTRDGYPVFFPLSGVRLESGEQMPGTEVVGLRKTFGKGRSTERVVYRVRRADLSYEDLPGFMYPTLFRPLNMQKYPDDLPPPATLTGEVDWGSEHPPMLPPDDPAPLDWVGPYALPPCISLDEIEVRVMRGLKTERAKGVDDRGLHGPSFKTGSDVLNGMLGGGAITIQGWVPDKRDIGDWPLVREWLRAIPDMQRRIVEWKSLDFSFRQICERYLQGRRSREWVRGEYRKGIEGVRGVANGSRQR